jgi:hypothetical protein
MRNEKVIRQVPRISDREQTMMIRLLALILVLLISACATPGPQPGESEIRYGKIARIDPVSLEGDHRLGLGAVIGADAWQGAAKK